MTYFPKTKLLCGFSSKLSFLCYFLIDFLCFTLDISSGTVFHISEFESALGNAALNFVCLPFIRSYLTLL